MIYTKEYHNNIETVKINSDSNGNPRYVVHFLDFLTEDEKQSYSIKTYQRLINLALERSRKVGGKKYRAKWYGGGIVIQSYNIRLTTEMINEIIMEAGK